MTSRSKKKKWQDRYITISRRRSFQQELKKVWLDRYITIRR